jgi:5S rRNA maturation endonuclease (ribonuclease M5)/beta-lactamase superfamily II metal-dependent hydrolase
LKKTDEHLFGLEILVTIEHYDEANNSILLDFLDAKHFSRFLETFNLRGDEINHASMLMLFNFSISKKFQLGVYYNVGSKISDFLNDIQRQNNSNVILFRIDFKGEDLRNHFLPTKVSSEYIYENLEDVSQKADSLDATIPSIVQSPIKKILIIKCVGQGSWNELSFDGEVKVVYDIGTSYLHDKMTVKALMGLRDLDYQKSKPIIILSHWDVDHYHLLLEAEDETIKSIAAFIYRSLIPNRTSKKLIDRFKALNPKALYPIQQETPNLGRTSDELKKIFGNKYGFFIFNGSKNKNRNKAGILLALKGFSQVIIFGADFHYEQINKYVLPNFHYKHDHYLVVPHHGGEAGKFIYDNLYSTCMDAIISVGSKYSYNHPLTDIKDELINKQYKNYQF